MKKTILISIFAVFFIPSIAAAQAIIYLKSGKPVRCKIIEQRDQYIKIEANGLITKYRWNEIERVEREDEPWRLLKQANRQFLEGNYDKSIQQYQAVIELDPSLAAVAYNNIGFAYGLGLNEWDSAIEYYKKAIKYDPEYAEGYSNLGVAYSTVKGNQEKAIEYFKKSIELNPLNTQSYFNLGTAYVLLDDKKGAQIQVDKLEKLKENALADRLKGFIDTQKNPEELRKQLSPAISD